MLSLSDIVNVKVGIGRGVFEAPGATVIGGKKPSFNLEILKLFANGEQGFWYDPNDMGTMFQDAAGTVPVTSAGQAVGLVLDKSKGLVLGIELLTNGDFSSGFSDWSNANNYWQIVDGKAYHALGTVLNALQRTITLIKHAWLEFDYEVIRGAAQLQYFGGPVNIAVDLRGKGRHRVFIPKGTSVILFKRVDNTEFYIDNVSLKEVTGNHAYQTTSAARPILQDTPRRIDFDAVDDKLITNLPTQLTGCTVIRSVPGVGVQLLTNQTIPATYEDNKDHCGLIVINRALTPSETSAITAEFNKRAGV